ncbi:MAG: hypothetical protein IJD30_07095 [Clostridia bacterium]|nr:hypothetical protein [Clostridia bacterium]
MKEVMKKLVIILGCLLCSSNSLVKASDMPEYPWIYEVFDNYSLGKVEEDGASLSVTEDGALMVSVGSYVTNGGGGYKIKTALEKGEKYKLSFLIRLEEGANIPRRLSVNNSYKEDGEIAKLYGAIREGETLQTLEFGDATYWSNENYVLIEQEFIYEYEGNDASLSFRVGERTDRGGKNLQGGASLVYYLDEVKLIPLADTQYASNPRYTFVEEESNMMQFSYDFSGTNNNSLAVLMMEENSKWETSKILGVGENVLKFQIPAELNGKKCKIVIYPADGTTAGAVCEEVIENLRLNVIEELSLNGEVITANVKLCYPQLKHVMVILCQYSEDNEMLDIWHQVAECNNSEEKEITLTADVDNNMKSASLLVWEGSDFKTSDMISLVDEMVVSR